MLTIRHYWILLPDTTLITPWMDFTSLPHLWTRLLFTSPKTSWTCQTLRSVVDYCWVRVTCLLHGLWKSSEILDFFSVIVTGSSHLGYLGRQRSRKVIPLWACVCQNGNQVSQFLLIILLCRGNVACNSCKLWEHCNMVFFLSQITEYAAPSWWVLEN